MPSARKALAAFLFAGLAQLLLACGAAATGSQSPGSRQSSPICSVSPKDDACDVCEAQKCCSEQTACATDSACEAADDELDSCEARASRAGAPSVSGCYVAFRATGPIAAKRASCLETNCKEQCF